MKLLIAAICAATSSPVETTLNSLSFAATSGWAAYAFAVLIIWMRQVFAMYPLASAMRYGPFLAGYWNSLVLPAHGAKHWASELGSDTTFGGAAVASPAAKSALRAAAHGRDSIKSSFDRESCSWQQTKKDVLFFDRSPDAWASPREDALDQVILQVLGTVPV